MDFVFVIFLGIGVLAVLSPLLTFVALFQLKEWRLDRLGEHLRREGALRSLFGRVRPLLAALFLAYILYTQFTFPAEDPMELGTYKQIMRLTAHIGLLLLFGLLSIGQIVVRRQRMPKWTGKAVTVTILSLLISTGVTFAAVRGVLLPIVLLLQPLWVLLAWLILKPLDMILKRRIMRSASVFRASLKNVTVIGIAGSVGKTTTKELLKTVLADLHPLSTPAHVNTEMGVAQWLLAQNRDAKLLIVEMGAYKKGEIALLCDIAQPTIGVMTALGSDHLALFGSEEAIVEANAELIEALPKDGMAYLNGDNDAARSLSTRSSCPVVIAGNSADATLRAIDIEEKDDGLYFHWHRTGQTTPHQQQSKAFIPLHGKHNISNIFLAIAVARGLGVSDDRIRELLATFRPVAHTFNVRMESGILLLDDTYNISPLSFRAALDWAAKQKQRPRVLLTSGLQETGAREETFLTELGKKASTCVERVVFTTKVGADTFAKAFGKPVEILHSGTACVSSGSVLLAVGRLPLSTVQRLLP